MRIATMDLETDPFEVGLEVQPFLWGYYDGSRFISIWDDDPERLIERSMEVIQEEPPTLIYAHNGGRFDVFFYLKDLSGSIKIINNRIVSCVLGKQEVRDSYSIMPFPLRSYKKKDIDYDKLKRENRHKNREEIVEYLQGDCVYLHELVSTFHSEFGNRLTIGGSSLRQLKQRHKFKSGGAEYDTRLRHDYYFGGRVQCYRSGMVWQRVKVYDVNSMYPHVMRAMLHPVSVAIDVSRRVERNTSFLMVEGRNYGAFPSRKEDGGLDFTRDRGRFTVTIHEWEAALETGTFKPSKIIKTYGFKERINFAEYIDEFFEKRRAAKALGDESRDLLYKYTLNSSYGKFAQNPDKFYDYRLEPQDTLLMDPCEHCHGSGYCDRKCHICYRLNHSEPPFVLSDEREPTDVWWCKFCNGNRLQWQHCEDHAAWRMWRSRPRVSYFYNIATGASITGAARAVLLRGLSRAVAPVYCDTDSIIAAGSRGLPLSETELGSWKVEATGDCMAVCGKKLYAVFSYDRRCIHGVSMDSPCKKCFDERIEAETVTLPNRRRGWVVKKASKGVRLTGQEIIQVAMGEEVTYENPVPHFKMSGDVVWIKRRVNKTE